MKKGVFIAAFLVAAVIIIAGFAYADDLSGLTSGDNSSFQDNAYRCLASLTPPNKTTLSFEEAVFSMLALGGQSNFVNITESYKSTTEACWPKTRCTLKDTALVALAYERIGKNNNDILDWITSKNKTTTDLTWYLQIDINDQKASKCTVTIGSTAYKVNVNDDMTLEGVQLGNCLTISNSYWLSIADGCVDKGLDVSCDAPFVTSLLYQKKGGTGTVYVTSTTKSGSRDGHTAQGVDAKCISVGGACDYEGNLWAALALNKAGIDTKDYIPYLLSLADDNQKYFPSTFLYFITGDDIQYNDITSAQSSEGFWDITSSPYNKFYNTALGLLGIGEKGGAAADSAKTYLQSTQTRRGCWDNDNIKNTAFLLYAGWGRGVNAVAETPPSSGTESRDCATSGFFCGLSSDCANSVGTIKTDKSCPNLGDICCSVAMQKSNCAQVGGKQCTSGESCSASEVPSSDGPCCLGDCNPTQAPAANACENAGGSCRSQCFSTETAGTEACTISGDTCCSVTAVASGGGSGWIWFIIILLIILAILGIIYRKKVKIWMYQISQKFKKKPQQAPGQRGPPQVMGRVMPLRSAMPPAMQRVMPGRVPAGKPAVQKKEMSAKDREFEETLKKLKEIGG